MGGVEPTGDACADVADGSYCLDNVNRVDCSGGELGTSEVCESGCINKACAVDPIEGNIDNPVITDPTVVDEGKQETVNDFPGLVSPSSGEVGGCSALGLEPAFLGLAFVGLLRRRRS
jgi:hypothetical protein